MFQAYVFRDVIIYHINKLQQIFNPVVVVITVAKSLDLGGRDKTN